MVRAKEVVPFSVLLFMSLYVCFLKDVENHGAVSESGNHEGFLQKSLWRLK